MDLNKLFEYQKEDMELHQIESALKKSEARKSLATSRTTLLDGQKAAQDFEKDIEAQKQELEVIINSFDKMNEEVEAVLAEGEKIKEVEEAKEMRKRAEKTNRDLKKMQQDIVATLKSVNEAQKKYHELVVKLQEAKQVFVESKQTCEEEIAKEQGNIDALKKNLEKLEKDVKPELLELYNKKKKNGLPVVAKLEGDQCSGCFMKLPQLTIDQMDGSGGIVECENCGRILLVETK